MLDIAIIGAAHPHVEYVLSEIANRPDVRVGQDEGSTATSRVPTSETNGKAMPAKLEPPPQEASTTSGLASPASASWSLASSPMIVWCRHTWLSTEPRA